MTDLKRVGASVGYDKPSCLLPLCKHTFGPCRKAFHLSYCHPHAQRAIPPSSYLTAEIVYLLLKVLRIIRLYANQAHT